MTDKVEGVLFRHKTIRRFRVAGYEFKNYQLRLESEKDIAAFKELLTKLPDRDVADIVIVNEAAAAAAETQAVERVGSGAVRGAMSAADILTAKDRERLAAGDPGDGTKPATTSTLGTMNLGSLLSK